MSQLVRQRRAHDLWISKSHLYAYGASAVLSVIIAFGAGYIAGQGSVDIPVVSPVAFASEAGSDELVELLARVDASATPDGGVRDLTFPDALTGQLPTVQVPLAVDSSEAVHLKGGSVSVPERGDLPPHGHWTLTAASVEGEAEAEELATVLRERDLEAWVAAEQVDGVTKWRVGVGGWGSKSEAEVALKSMRTKVSLEGAPVVVTRF